MTWGQLATSVAQLRAPVTQDRDLDLVMAERIAWQETGSEAGLAVPAVYAAVRLIASTIDQLRLVAPGDPDWLRHPRKYDSMFDQGDLIQFVVSSMATRGRAYLLARRPSPWSKAWRLDPVHDDQVAVQVGVAEQGHLTMRFTLAGRPIDRLPIYQEGESNWSGGPWLIHIPYLVTPEHPAGIGPLQAARVALGGYAEVERQAANLLDNGTYSGGRLETDQDITADTARRYQETWVINRKTGRLPVLGAGLRYVNDLIDPSDAQWLESRQFNAQQVAQMFGIPPDYLGMSMSGGSSSLSYSNSSDNDRRFRRNCLEAFTTQIADAMSVLLQTQKDEVSWDWAAWEQATGSTDEGSADAAPEPDA